jgi:hypothetical protein
MTVVTLNGGVLDFSNSSLSINSSNITLVQNYGISGGYTDICSNMFNVTTSNFSLPKTTVFGSNLALNNSWSGKNTFIADTSFNNTTTQINSSTLIGLSGGLVNISGSVINICGGAVNVNGTTNVRSTLYMSNSNPVYLTNAGTFGAGMLDLSRVYFGFGTASSNGKFICDNVGNTSADGSGAFYVSSANGAVITNNGLAVGKSTRTAGYALDVSGNANVNNVVLMGTSINGLGPNTKLDVKGTNPIIGLQSNNGNDSLWGMQAFSTGLQFGNYNGSFDGLNPYFCISGSLVGIGKTSPSYTLDVNGTTSSSKFICGNGDNVADQGVIINTGWIDASNYSAFAPLKVSLRGTSVFQVNTNGNVGIGTTNPTDKLYVNGNIVSKNLLLQGDGTHAYIRPTNALSNLYLGSNNNNIMTINSLGNVGIGNISPGYKLDVSGNAYINGNVGVGSYDSNSKLRVDYIGIVETQNVLSLHANNIGSMNYNLIEAGHGTNTTFVLRGNGSIGLGTTTPGTNLSSSKLSVIGGIDCDNLVRYYELGQLRTGNFLDVGTEIGTAHGHFVWGYGDKRLTFGTNGTEKMTILSNGNVGIGNASPKYPLHIDGQNVSKPYNDFNPSVINYLTTSGVYTNHNGTTGYLLGTNFSIGMFCNYNVATGSWFIGYGIQFYSDTRIKSNIVDIDDNTALSILRQIKPKTYDYVDKIKNGNANVIGFIAQEIKEILPKAVSTIKDYIPNFYTNCFLTFTDVSNILLVNSPIDLSWNPLHDASGNAFMDASYNASSDASGNKLFNVKFYDQQNNEILCKTTNVLDKRNFLVDITNTNLSLGEYFLHGQEIDDFHTLDKAAIFTVVTAAVQDIDRIVQTNVEKINADSERITALEEQVASLQSQLALLQSQLALFQSQISSLIANK